MRRLSLLLFPAILVILLLPGCAGRPPAYEHLYEGLIEELAPPDAGVLAGRRIVLDPGHGGAFDGAVGVDSLTEAEVNLGVALYLWGLLSEAGADVMLTRSTDRDFLPDSTGETADDLAVRVQRANAFAPDVFLSIHHNASPEYNRGKNAVELYYRADDPLASLELAVDLHTHLARNLGIDETGIRPGTYFVLRRSTAGAAVLGEASYISHPAVEERLRIAAKQQLEAEAYYLGLVSYFSRGVPVIDTVGTTGETMTAPGAVVCRITPAAGVPVDPASITASVDRRTLTPVLLSGGIAAFDLPADLPNGPHELRIRASSVAGATGVLGPLHIVIDRPAAFILPLPRQVPAPGEPRLVRVLVLAGEGRPVADGTSVTAEGPAKELMAVRTRGGTAAFEISPEAKGTLTVSAGGAASGISIEPLPSAAGAVVRPIDALTGMPVAGASAILEGGGHQSAGEDGLIRLSPSDSLPLTVKAPGYRYLFEGTAADTAFMEPLFGGALHGMRISIDPDGGGPDDAGRGAGGLRGASVDLALARILETALEAGGAAVLLARTGEEPISIHERIFRVNAFGSDMALQLRCGGAAAGDSCAFLHYPGSARGTALADSIAASAALIPPCGGVCVRGSAELFLQQTACPATVFLAGSLDDQRTETLFRSPRWMRLQVQALLRGILSWAGGDRFAPVEMAVRVVTDDGSPVVLAAVTIDGAVTLLTGDDGTAVFTCFEAGTHGCLVSVPDAAPLLLRIEAGSGPIECILP